jgi:Flp pilus assembly pilin Flp
MARWPSLAVKQANAGQGMVEYALLLALLAIVVILMLFATGRQVINLYSDVVSGTTAAGM